MTENGKYYAYVELFQANKGREAHEWQLSEDKRKNPYSSVLSADTQHTPAMY